LVARLVRVEEVAGSNPVIPTISKPKESPLNQAFFRFQGERLLSAGTRATLTSPQRLNAIAVSPDRSLIAIAGDAQMVLILDADTLAEKDRFRAHDAAITALRFHPSLPILATGSSDYSLKLWDYRTTKLRKTFLGIGGSPVMIAFSPNGKLLAVDGMEYAFHLFDVSDMTR
jgi:WD40 repeat protein